MSGISVEQIMNQIRNNITKDERRKHLDYEGRFVSKYHSSILDRIKDKKQIVLFGAGRYGKLIYYELKKDHIKSVKCFCDNNKSCIGMEIDGGAVMLPEEAFQKYPEAVFVITVINSPVEITAQLLEMGVQIENIIFYNYARSGL